jgi:chromosome segregation ATPase
MYFPLISRADYQYLASLLTISNVKIKNRFRDEELSLDKLRHECSNYDEVRLNKNNEARLTECLTKYDRDRVTIYLKLIVNSMIAKSMLEAAQTLKESAYRNHRAKLAKVDSELEELRTLYELTDLKVDSLEDEVAILKISNDKLTTQFNATDAKYTDALIQLQTTNDTVEQLIEEATNPLHLKIDELLAKMGTRDLEITDLTTKVSASDLEIADLTTKVSARDLEIKRLNKLVAEQEITILNQQQALKDLALELAATKADLAETKQRLTKTEEVVSQLADKLSSLFVEHADLANEINDEDDAVCALPKIQAGITAKVMPIVNLLKVTEKGTVAHKARERQLEKWLTALIKCTQRCNEFIDASFELTILEAARDKYLTVPVSAPANPSAISKALRKHAKGFARFF